MNEFSEECLVTFLRKQEQLFAEPVAETVEEAEAFLEDCMAVVVDTLEEVKAAKVEHDNTCEDEKNKDVVDKVIEGAEN